MSAIIDLVNAIVYQDACLVRVLRFFGTRIFHNRQLYQTIAKERWWRKVKYYRKDNDRKTFYKKRAHFKTRLFERYHVKINDGEYQKYCEEIIKGNFTQFLVRKDPDGRFVYKITIHGALVGVVYDNKFGCLVTVLPKWSV